jgi:CDP-paratose 2-epimerase
MKILITGICGFVGSALAFSLRTLTERADIVGIDSLARAGSEGNRGRLRASGIRVFHGDVRCASDLEGMPDVDWVIDAAANPSVRAGIDGRSTARQLVEHNLLGTANVLEYCRRVGAGLVLLSTSRVYSIPALSAIRVRPAGTRFELDVDAGSMPAGASIGGLSEAFSTQAPVSLYGSTKLASECLALEYAASFSLPVWVDRCGVLAGAGQFGTADQGVYTYWIHAWRTETPLRYIGFGGTGWQVRDVLHPEDLGVLVWRQMTAPDADGPRICNVGGGRSNSASLAELSAWCTARFGPRHVAGEPETRPLDVPWIVMDCSRAGRLWGWVPSRSLDSIFAEIATFAEEHPRWLELTRD